MRPGNLCLHHNHDRWSYGVDSLEVLRAVGVMRMARQPAIMVACKYLTKRDTSERLGDRLVGGDRTDVRSLDEADVTGLESNASTAVISQTKP